MCRFGHRRPGVDDLEDPLHPGPGLLRHREQQGDGAGRSDDLEDVAVERDEGAERDVPADRQQTAESEDADLADRGDEREGGRQRRGGAGDPELLGEQGPRPVSETSDLPVLLAEALDHPDPGDVLLDDVGDVGGGLLGGPAGREQPSPGAEHDPDHQRHHHHDDQAEQRRQHHHDHQRDAEEHRLPGRQREERQQPLHQPEVGVGPGDDLPGAELVLQGTVERLHRGEDALPQVVLNGERQLAAGVAPQERQPVLHHREQ